MAVITIPSDVIDYIARQSFGVQSFDLDFASDLTGAAQTRLLAPPRWTCSIVGAPTMGREQAAYWRQFILRVRGRVNQLAVYDMLNTAPRGTMRGTLTVNSNIAVGDTTYSITGGSGQAATTLLKGDLLQINTAATRQLIVVAADATANGSGVISVTSSIASRYVVTAETSVVWDKPTCLMRRRSGDASWDVDGDMSGGFSLDLIESWES
jgi:hypothetical protein